jgi:hypothetical protein
VVYKSSPHPGFLSLLIPSIYNQLGTITYIRLVCIVVNLSLQSSRGFSSDTEKDETW